MKLETNLPILLEFGDYHEIDAMYDLMKKVIPGVKRKELDNYDREYIGLFYHKKLCAKAKALIKEQKAVVKLQMLDEENEYHTGRESTCQHCI